MRILILEDEPLIALHLAQELRFAGYDIIGPAPTLESADLLLETETPDFAILDANVRGCLPIKIAEDLARRSIPFVYITGYNRSYIRTHLPDAPVLSKPIEMKSLKQMLARA